MQDGNQTNKVPNVEVTLSGKFATSCDQEAEQLHMVPPDPIHPCNNNYALNQSIHNNNKIALWHRLLTDYSYATCESALLLEEQRERAEKDFVRLLILALDAQTLIEVAATS